MFVNNAEVIAGPGLLKRKPVVAKGHRPWFVGPSPEAFWEFESSWSDRRPQKEFRCHHCEAKFSALITLRLHKEREHPEEYSREKDLRQLCGLCGESFLNRFLLIKHVADSAEENGHDLPIKILTKRFLSELDFEAWKTESEEQLGFHFTLDGGVRVSKDGFKRRYYQCHRSGRPQIFRNVKEKGKFGSIKTGFTCSAFCFLKTDPADGTCESRYCLDHYGHDEQGTGRRRLSLDVRERVKEMMLDGLDNGQIRECISHICTPAEDGKDRVPKLLNANVLGSIRRSLGIATSSPKRKRRKKTETKHEEEQIIVVDQEEEPSGREKEETRLRIEEGLRNICARVWEIQELGTLRQMEEELERLRQFAESSVATLQLQQYSSATDNYWEFM